MISGLFLLRMRNVSNKFVEKIKTHILCLINPPPENCTVQEKMWENILQPDRQQTTVRRMHSVCWIPKATNSHSEYAILIASPQQQLLCQCASILRYAHIASLV